MSKASKQWVDIKEFCNHKDVKVEKREIYQRLNQREWWDGYVIKKTPTGRIKWGCIQDFNHWSGK